MGDHTIDPQAAFRSGAATLAAQGLNLIAVVPMASLPAAMIAPLDQAGHDLAAARRLVLLGNGGRAFWHALTADQAATKRPPTEHPAEHPTEHPVDSFSLHLAREFVVHCGGNPDDPRSMEMLYPAPAEQPFPLSLQALGEFVNWVHPSPLGLGIHPEFGLWNAYRAAFLTDLPLPVTVAAPHASPCAACQEKPCVTTCPAAAVEAEAGLDLWGCSHFRLVTDSPCAERCLARLACPVGADHRYRADQIAYHYSHSLATIRAYLHGT
ncbi:MAG: hypothetical protein KDD78_01250 [Caldilineaceae bacterium]|nr:hypothetical protein [Caldilineaceae bacterium]